MLKRRTLKVLLAIVASVAFSAFCIAGFIDMAHRVHTRGLAHELAAIPAVLEKTQPGTPRAEEFLRRLKAVDPGLAPAEVKQALHDYVAIVEGGLEAMRSGRNTEQYDAPMARAEKSLAESLNKYQDLTNPFFNRIIGFWFIALGLTGVLCPTFCFESDKLTQEGTERNKQILRRSGACFTICGVALLVIQLLWP